MCETCKGGFERKLCDIITILHVKKYAAAMGIGARGVTKKDETSAASARVARRAYRFYSPRFSTQPGDS
jgi:hypothetical protein